MRTSDIINDFNKNYPLLERKVQLLQEKINRFKIYIYILIIATLLGILNFVQYYYYYFTGSGSKR